MEQSSLVEIGGRGETSDIDRERREADGLMGGETDIVAMSGMRLWR